MNEEWGDVVLNPAEVGAEVSLTPGKNGEQRFTLTLTGKVSLHCTVRSERVLGRMCMA